MISTIAVDVVPGVVPQAVMRMRASVAMARLIREVVVCRTLIGTRSTALRAGFIVPPRNDRKSGHDRSLIVRSRCRDR